MLKPIVQEMHVASKLLFRENAGLVTILSQDDRHSEFAGN